MTSKLQSLGLVLMAFCGVLAAPVAWAQQPLKAEVAFPDLRFHRPLFLTHPGDGSDRLVVAEQGGRVYIFDNRASVGNDDKHLMIDLRQVVIAPGQNGQNEEGLLGLAFHPGFKDNGLVFLHYSRSGPKRNVLSRFKVAADGRTIDPASEEVIMEVPQPYWNHNGGMIAFGPDGYLYIAIGDGGAGGDPQNNAQNLGLLLGKMLRIDVDTKDETRGLAYGIPRDNPFIEKEGVRPEIFAYGLRNVWRFSFDRQTGALWAGDVGQNLYEEIDIIQKGMNYGWRVREAKHDFEGGRKDERPELMIDPVIEYPRSDGKSVTGGYVYRGQGIPRVQGYYIFGDYETGKMWMLQHDGRRVRQHVEIGNVPRIASFGEDRDGELYICSFGNNADNPDDDRIYKFVPSR